jgi:hypothetical protein
MALAEAPTSWPATASKAIEPDGVPVDFFLAYIETDPLVSEEDRAWFRALLGTPRPLA